MIKAMKAKHLKTSILLVFLSIGSLQAQQATLSAGNDAAGSGGSSSFSVGQVFYQTHVGANGSSAQGVQQPYEISVTNGIEVTSIRLELSVYPNPVAEVLNLMIDWANGLSLEYQLLDLQGRVVKSDRITGMATAIDMQALATSTYFLKVTAANGPVKTFKIIKN